MTHEIDLWIFDLAPGDARVAELSAYLSQDEIARADRFVHAIDSSRFRAGRGRLREILAEIRGEAPRDLAFDYNAQGRPSLAGGPFFNLSHSHSYAALAVSVTLDIGVDIEGFRKVEEGVARRFFAKAECAALAALPEDAWQAGFFRCWTRKEAIIKAHGLGLSMPLDSFEVTLVPGEAPALHRLDGGHPGDWQLWHLDIGPAMVGAVAAETAGAPARIVPRGDFYPRAIS